MTVGGQRGGGEVACVRLQECASQHIQALLHECIGVFGIPLPDLGIEFTAMLHTHATAGLAVGIVGCDVSDLQCH